MNHKKRNYVIGVAVVLLGLGLFVLCRGQSVGNSGFDQNGKVGMETGEKGGKKTKGKGTESGGSNKVESGEEGQTETGKAEKEANVPEQSRGNHNENSRTDEGESVAQKKERVIVEDTNYDAIDNTLYSWWFKRNDNHEKSGCQDDFDISEFDAHYTVPVSEKKIYITFDCGYENGYTADILDTLKEEQVPAAFFVTQTYIRDNINLVKRMKEEGHLVCNHTVTHPTMPSKSVEEQKKELLTCEQYMKETTGYDMDLFFRPPKGEYSKRTLQMAKDLGYTTVFWSMAYLDYDVNNQPSSDHVVEHFKKYYHPGAIPLLHNVSVANRDALSRVLKNLKKEGYGFGTLYELKE